ncbi:MAG: hypothetical protein AAF447_10730 [Myxococcota bacterium]
MARWLRSLAIGLVVLAWGCGETVVTPASPGSAHGDACGPCGALNCIDDRRFPGGYCSEACDEGACPPGATCVEDYGTPLCFRACDGAADCPRREYACFRGACRPPCTADLECGAGARCEAGSCVEGCGNDEECSAGERCDSGRCVPGLGDLGTDMPPADLGTDVGPGGCDPARCPGVCLPLGGYGGRCATRCAASSECPFPGLDRCAPVDFDDDGDGSVDRVELACVRINAEGAPLAGRCRTSSELADCASRACIARQCVEACTRDTDCLAGQQCLDVVDGPATLRLCGYAPASGVIDVEVASFDVGGGVGRGGALALAPDARSVMLLATRSGGLERPLAFTTVVNAAGTELYSLADLSAGVDPPLRWIPGDTEEVAALLAPNSTADRLAFLPGRLEFGVVGLGPRDDVRPTNVRVRARVLRGRVPTAGRVALDVHLGPGLVGLDAASAAGNTRLQDTLERAGDILDARGLTLDVAGARYFDVRGARFQTIDSTDGTDSELSDLFRTTAPGSDDRLAVFFVRSISGGSGFATLGVAGAIPGPAGPPGTGEGGVVVAFDEAVVGDATFAGQVLAHELGHYFGLFHVTERLPACGPGESPPSCAPFGGADVLADTRTGDERNLMHWTPTMAGGTPNVRLSEGQGFVLLRHPLAQTAP